MNNKDKLLEKLKHKSLTWNEMVKLLTIHNYIMLKSNSYQRTFRHKKDNLLLIIHQDDQCTLVKRHVINEIIIRLGYDY